MHKSLLQKLSVPLLLSLTLICSACSTQPTVQQQTILLAPPSELLLPLPVAKADASSKTGIARGYIQNTASLGTANKQLKAITEWVKQQQQLYEAKK